MLIMTLIGALMWYMIFDIIETASYNKGLKRKKEFEEMLKNKNKKQ